MSLAFLDLVYSQTLLRLVELFFQRPAALEWWVCVVGTFLKLECSETRSCRAYQRMEAGRREADKT